MKILNFGSLNIDHVYQVPHFVREGETLGSTAYARHVGGKGLNQSIALARAGAQVYHAGCIGQDGAFLADYLKQNGVDTAFVKAIETPTGHAIIQVDTAGRNCILLYGGANQCVTPAFVDEVLAGFVPGDILLLQNEINCMETILRAAHGKGLRIALNPSPISPALLALPLELVDILVLNEIEGQEMTDETEPERIILGLQQKYPGCQVVLTLGSKGAVYAEGQLRIQRDALRVKAVDTTAAGDTFTGYFLCGIAAGISPEQALHNATRAAAITVTRPGAAQSIPHYTEL